MFRRFGHVLMIVAVLATTGTHWLVLQSVAWTTMLAGNLHTTCCWQEAVTQTFDGKHPCCLCKQISKGKSSEKKSDLQLDLKKLEYSYTSGEFVFYPPSDYREMPTANELAVSLPHAPPVPPPREFLG